MVNVTNMIKCCPTLALKELEQERLEEVNKDSGLNTISAVTSIRKNCFAKSSVKWTLIELEASLDSTIRLIATRSTDSIKLKKYKKILTALFEFLISMKRYFQIQMNITFEEAARGVNKNVSVNVAETCWVCHGSKCEPGKTLVSCPYCNGTGMVS